MSFRSLETFAFQARFAVHEHREFHVLGNRNIFARIERQNRVR